MRLGTKNIFEGNNTFREIVFWSFCLTKSLGREQQSDPGKAGSQDQRFHENAYLGRPDVDATEFFPDKYFQKYICVSFILVLLPN